MVAASALPGPLALPSNARDGADEQFIPDSEGTCNGQVFDAFNFQQAFVRYDKDGIAMLS